jgi:hypothetical protein
MHMFIRSLSITLTIASASFAQDAQWQAMIDGKLVPAPAIDMGDDRTVRKILEEGIHRNQVMEHLTHLTKEIGPRITTGSATESANRWCAEQYERWGLVNVRVEKWGEYPVRFDRGPSSAKVLLRRERKDDAGNVSNVEFDDIRTLEFSTLAWTKGTDGPRRGHVIREPKTEEEYAAVKDKLPGAWILLKAPAPLGQRGIRGRLSDYFSRRIDARAKLAAGTPASELPIAQRLVADNVAGWLTTSRDERVWTGGAPDWTTRTLDQIPDDVHLVIRGSDYDFINSRIADEEPIELEVDANHVLTAGPIPVYNTLAEIKGTEFPDEVVIISAHLDSWDGPGSEGCTDNGTGSAVTLEAARILAAVGAKPKRTIIFANWTGEEQGLLGSKAWVQANKDRWDNISACFVDDGGTNYEGGLGVPDWQVDILAAASAPTNNMFFDSLTKEPLNVNIRGGGRKERGGGSSDHASFLQVGIPGYFWDETGRAEYGFGWHTQHDKLDLAIPEYLMQSATNAAIVAYRLACAPTLIPRDDPNKAPEKSEQESSADQTAKPN